MSASRLKPTYTAGDQQHDRLHHRHVTVVDGVHEAGADARVVEHVLHHDHAARQPGEVQGDDLDAPE